MTPTERAGAREVAESLLAQALAVEVGISFAVRWAIESNGGELARFDRRFKPLPSLVRKIEAIAVEDETTVDDAAAEVNDVLRYTAVLDAPDYWSRGGRIRDSLIQAGYVPTRISAGWKPVGYRGRNDSFVGPDGVEFELQIHTTESLHAAEVTHLMYEEERLTSTPKVRKVQLRAMQNDVFAAVSVPDGIRWA